MAVRNSQTAKLTLPTEEQIVITREFDAPRHLVYRAYTTPDLVKRWFHAKRGTVTIADIDLRVGGTWRYVMVTDSGEEVAFHGEYRELVPDERIVTTEVYEGVPEPEPGQEVVNTVTLEEVDGRTRWTLVIQCPSREVRDAIVDSGMEEGLQDALDLIEELAGSLR